MFFGGRPQKIIHIDPHIANDDAFLTLGVLFHLFKRQKRVAPVLEPFGAVDQLHLFQLMVLHVASQYIAQSRGLSNSPYSAPFTNHHSWPHTCTSLVIAGGVT